MLRFRVNRWWAKTVTLQIALFVAAALMIGSAIRAQAGTAFDYDPGEPKNQGPGGVSAGDPDIPTGNIVLTPGLTDATSGGGVRGTVDSESAFLIRLRVFALGLRAYWLRF